MRFPRVRFTVRRMMVAVAVVAVAFGLLAMARRMAIRRSNYLGSVAIYLHLENSCSEQAVSTDATAKEKEKEGNVEAAGFWSVRSARHSRRALYFRSLLVKYERAARYPRLPVAPVRQRRRGCW